MKKLIALLLAAACIAGSKTNTSAQSQSEDFRTEFMIGYKTESDSGFVDAEGDIFSLGFVSEHVISNKTYRVVMLGYDTETKEDDEIVDFIDLEIYEIEKIEKVESKANQLESLYADVFYDSEVSTSINGNEISVYVDGELRNTMLVEV